MDKSDDGNYICQVSDGDNESQSGINISPVPDE